MWTLINDPRQITGIAKGMLIYRSAGDEPPGAPVTEDPRLYTVKEVKQDLLVFTQSDKNSFSISGHSYLEILNGDWWIRNPEEHISRHEPEL